MSWQTSALISRQWRNCKVFFCHWEEDGTPVKCFLDKVPLKKVDAEIIYLALVKCTKDKYLQVGTIDGIGVGGAATFSGKKTGLQTRLKKHAPHAVFVLCHFLQLAYVEAVNSTPGIMHVYTTLTTLWKYFHNSLKRAESLKEIQKVIKSSDTHWLAKQ